MLAADSDMNVTRWKSVEEEEEEEGEKEGGEKEEDEEGEEKGEEEEEEEGGGVLLSELWVSRAWDWIWTGSADLRSPTQ